MAVASGKQKIEIILSAQDGLLTSALKKGQASIKAFATTTSGAVSPLASMAGAALNLRTALAGVVSTAAVAALGRSFIQAGLDAQKLQVAFTSIMGSSAAATTELGWLRAETDKLGVDFNSAAGAYKTIAGAAQGTVLAGQKTREVFLSVARASTVMGLSADETSGALLAISQMISKGKVSAEELRGQLGERLPGAFQIAARAMGMTTAELDKFMADGKLMAEDFIPKFATALSNQFAGGANAASIGFQASSNRIVNEFTRIKTAFGEAVTNNTFFVGALNIIAGSLKGLATEMSTNATAWRQWAKESALSVLQFVADTAGGFNSVYQSLSWLAGSLKLAYIGALLLGQGFQFLFEQANRLTGDTAKADYWAKAQQDAARLIDEAMQGAATSFQNAEQGSTTLETITTRVGNLKEELEKLKAEPLNPVAGVAKETKTELAKVGDEWTTVQRTITKETKETTADAKIDWSKVFDTMERDGKKAATEISKALDDMAKPREVTVKVREVTARAMGGMIHRLARGGRLSGYGGGDRIPALLEAGEFVVRKEAVARFGSGLFSMLNNLQLPDLSGFSAGGPALAGSGGAVSPLNVTLNYQGGGSSTDAKRMADMVFAEINRRWRARS